MVELVKTFCAGDYQTFSRDEFDSFVEEQVRGQLLRREESASVFGPYKVYLTTEGTVFIHECGEKNPRFTKYISKNDVITFGLDGSVTRISDDALAEIEKSLRRSVGNVAQQPGGNFGYIFHWPVVGHDTRVVIEPRARRATFYSRDDEAMVIARRIAGMFA